MPYKRLAGLLIQCLLSALAGRSQTFQYLTIDSALSTNSEQMGIGRNGKTDGIKMYLLGPFSTSYVEKLDSGAFRSKIKENKEVSFSSDNGLEEFKTKRIEEHAFFRMGVSNGEDSVTAFFSLFTSVRKKSETVLSAILSKKDETTSSEYFDDRKLVEGAFNIKNESLPWRFMLNYPPSSGRVVNTSVDGFLTNGRDSLVIGFVYSDILRRSKKDPAKETIMMRSARGYTLIDWEKKQMAALIFKQDGAYIGAKKLGYYTGSELVMISKENTPSNRLAIVTLFAIMLGIQGY